MPSVVLNEQPGQVGNRVLHKERSMRHRHRDVGGRKSEGHGSTKRSALRRLPAPTIHRDKGLRGARGRTQPFWGNKHATKEASRVHASNAYAVCFPSLRSYRRVQTRVPPSSSLGQWQLFSVTAPESAQRRGPYPRASALLCVLA